MKIPLCKKLLFPLLFLMFFQTSFAQNGKVQGKIHLEGEKTPLVGITVYLKDSNLGTVSNGEGSYRIKNIAPGEYTLLASCIGYTPLEQKIRLSEGEVLDLDLELTESITDLPAVVVRAVSLTGGLRGIKEIPGSAHYISPQEIEQYSYTDINRTLRSVPGVNLQEEDGFGLRPNIGLRGTGSERSSKITLMEDGVLAAPAPYSAPAAYYFPTIGRMQAVEVLKGSSQIRFGPYTTGGAINLISTAIPKEFSGKLSLLGGSFGNRNLHANVGNSHKNFAYLVETFQFLSDGFKKLDRGGDTGFDKKDYLAKFRLNTNPNAPIYQSLTFKVGQARESSNETYLGLNAEDFEETPYHRYAASQKDLMETEHTQYSLQHLIQLSKAVDITTTAYQTNFSRNWYKLDKITDASGQKTSIAKLLDHPANFETAYEILQGGTSPNNNALQVKANNRSYLSKGVQSIIGIALDGTQALHTLDIGFRYHYDEVDRFQWVDDYKMENGIMELTEAGEGGTESNRLETATAFASYLQYKLKLGKWTFLPGLRYENISLTRADYGKNDPERLGTELSERKNEADVLIPGLGFDYTLNKQVNIFGGIHKGFSPPGSEPETEPEESINYELGFRYQKGALSGQSVLFHNQYDNLLGTDLAASGGLGSGDLFNGGKVKTQGIEFQLSYDLLSDKDRGVNLPISLTYTFTDARFQNSFESSFGGWGDVVEGDELPYLAKHQLAINTGFNSLKFGFNASARYQSAMRTIAGQGAIPENGSTDAYFILDLTTNYVVHQNVSLFASVTNLLNEVYIVARRPAGLRPGLPRALLAGIKANF